MSSRNFLKKITGRILKLCNIRLRRKNKYVLSSFSKWRGILFSRHLTPMGKLVYGISIFGAMFQNLHVLIPPPPQNKWNLSWITLSKCLIPLVRTFWNPTLVVSFNYSSVMKQFWVPFVVSRIYHYNIINKRYSPQIYTRHYILKVHSQISDDGLNTCSVPRWSTPYVLRCPWVHSVVMFTV